MILKWNNYEILNESLQKARSILRRLNINEDDKRFLELRELLRRNPGYLGKFTEWLFVGKQSINNLESLYDRIKGVRLSKPIDEFKTVEDVIDSLVRDSASTAVNQMVNAIPSRTREYLKSSGEQCMQCDGDKVLACDECTRGVVKCDCGVRLNGGKTKYDKYDKDCKKCGGSGRYDCKKCDGEGEIPCTYCNNADGSEDWKKLLSFLSLQREKRDLIISFFSKKGGRYGEDADYYEDDDGDEKKPIDRIIEDLKKVLDVMDIESLKKSIEDSNDAKILHNDDEYLIIAVNYRGIRKYGSSYWCIYESEDTFNEYVYEECDEDSINFQLIAYNKKLVPFVDDKSVIGITLNIIKDEITAAHYEDDSECSLFAKKMLENIKLDRSAIVNAVSIYNKNLYDEVALIIGFPENYIKEIDEIIDDEHNDYFLSSILCSDDPKPAFINVLKERLTIRDCKFKINDEDALINVFKLGLVKFLNIDKYAIRPDIFRIMSSYHIPVKDSVEIIKTYISAGYVPRLNDHSLKYIGPCIRSGAFKLEDIYKNIGCNGDWIDIIGVVSKSKLSTLFKYILKNDFDFIKGRFLRQLAIWLSTNNAELNKYLDKFIESIVSRKYNKEEMDWLLEFIDNDEIDKAVYMSLFSRNTRISKKWDIDMKRRVTERLKSYYEFNKVNEDFDEDGIVKIETDEDFLKYNGNEFFPLSKGETESINIFLKSELPKYRLLTPNYGKKFRNNIITSSILDRMDRKFNDSEITGITFMKTVGFNYKIHINTTTELSTFVAKDINNLFSFLKKILS